MSKTVYFPGNIYSMYKGKIKEIIRSYELTWNYGKSGWFGKRGSIEATFEGSGLPVTFVVSGEIESAMVKVAEIVGGKIVESGRDISGYMLRNTEGYMKRYYEDLMDRGCEQLKAIRLTEEYRKAWIKRYGDFVR